MTLIPHLWNASAASVLMLGLALCAAPALAQDALPHPAPQAAPLQPAVPPPPVTDQVPDAPQARAPEPGVFGVLGKLVDDTLAGVNEGIDNARATLGETAGRATETARGAGDAVGKAAMIPLTSVVAGRQRCVAASNKAPDCQAATDALCRNKGFATGRSVDVQSAQRCPPEIWISGRQPAPGECTMETYVTRAMCQ